MKTIDATTITIPNLDSLSNPYLIIYDIRTGYLVNAETGSVSVSTTWADAAFDEGHWTGGEVSAVTGWPNYIIPALSKDYNYGILVCDGASPARTDIVYRSGFYSAITGIPYTDSSPTYKGEVLVR